MVYLIVVLFIYFKYNLNERFEGLAGIVMHGEESLISQYMYVLVWFIEIGSLIIHQL